MAITVPEDVVEVVGEPLQYKTWFLKVSIHCEGCKRKVKRILNGIEGVYKVDVDTKQQKVVVTGNIDAETLIKKLVKAGKHVELWPIKGKKPPKEKNPKEKNPDKQSDTESSDEEPDRDEKPPGLESANSILEVKDPSLEAKKPPMENGPAGGLTQLPPQGSSTTATTGGAKKKKKKKRKSNNNNSNNNNNGSTVRMVGGQGELLGGPIGPPPPTSNLGPPQMNQIPPHFQGNQFPPTHYFEPPPQPQSVYVTSYNTAHPTISMMTPHYASQPSQSYMYMHQGFLHENMVGEESLSSELENPSKSSLYSFELLSDEDPNGCTIL